MPGKRIVTWLLVADGARAEVFAANYVDGGLRPVLVKEYAESHPRTREMVSDRPGRLRDGPNGGVHATAKTDWHALDKEAFAHELAAEISQAAMTGRFDRLVLVAPPKTLGALRAALHKEASRRVVGEVPKDLTGLRPHDILAQREMPMVA